MFRSRKSAFTATTLFAASAAALVIAAPGAQAYVTNVTVSSGSSIGGGYGTNCSYTVTVNGSPNESIWLYDSNSSTFSPQQFSLGTGGTATSSWTPTATGTHYVQAWSYNGSQWANLTVKTGINLGSACIVSS